MLSGSKFSLLALLRSLHSLVTLYKLSLDFSLHTDYLYQDQNER